MIAEKNWINLLGFCLLVVGFVIIVYYGMDTRNYAYMIKDHGRGWGYGTHVNGKIVALHADRGSKFRPLLQFTDNTGRVHDVPAQFLVTANHGYNLSDHLLVAYDTHQPDKRYYVYHRGQQQGKLLFSDYAGVLLGSVMSFFGILLVYIYRKINSY